FEATGLGVDSARGRLGAGAGDHGRRDVDAHHAYPPRRHHERILARAAPEVEDAIAAPEERLQPALEGVAEDEADGVAAEGGVVAIRHRVEGTGQATTHRAARRARGIAPCAVPSATSRRGRAPPR